MMLLLFLAALAVSIRGQSAPLERAACGLKFTQQSGGSTASGPGSFGITKLSKLPIALWHFGTV